MSETERPLSPSVDPLVRARVHAILSSMVFGTRDVLSRHVDTDNFFIEPSGVSDGGDVTGVIYSGHNSLILGIQRKLDQARADLVQVLNKAGVDVNSLDEPSEAARENDVARLVYSAHNGLIVGLQRELDKARAGLTDVINEIDEHKRQTIGPNYRPIRKPL